MTGIPQAQRIYLDHRHRQLALERGDVAARPQSNKSGKYDDVKHFTDDELERILADSLEKAEKESGKGHVSSMD